MCRTSWAVSYFVLSIHVATLIKCNSGMARIFTAAPGLVKLMNGRKWGETGLPEVYQMTTERLDKLKKESGSAERIAVI